MEAICIGSFLFDPETGRLSGGADDQTLRRKTADLLTVFLDSGGRVMGKDELLGLVWGQTEVSDNTLTQSIQEIRRALGDDARTPRYLKTLPRRGYQWIAAPPRKTLKSYRRKGIIGLLIFFLLLSVALIRSFLSPEHAAIESSQKIAILPFDNATGVAANQWMELGLADMVVRQMARFPKLDPLPSMQLHRRLLDAEMSSTWSTPQQASVLANALGVEYLVSVGIEILDDGFLFQVTTAGPLGDIRSQELHLAEPIMLVDKLPMMVVKMLGLEADSIQFGEQSNNQARRHLLLANRDMNRIGPHAARARLETALALEPDLIEAHALLANVLYQQGEWQEAEPLLLSLLDDGPSLPARDLMQLGSLLGEIYYARGQINQSLTYMLEVERLALESNSPAKLARTRAVLGEIQHLRGKTQFDQATVTVSSASEDPQLKVTNAFYAIRDHDLDDRKRMDQFRFALAFYRQRDDLLNEAITLLSLASTDLLDSSRRPLMLQQALTALTTIGHQPLTAKALNRLGKFYLFNGQGQAGKEPLRQALSMNRQLGAVFNAAQDQVFLGMVEYALWLEGSAVDLDQVDARWQYTLDVFRPLGNPILNLEPTLLRASLALDREQWGQANSLFAAAREFLPERGSDRWRALLDRGQARTLAALSDPGAGVDLEKPGSGDRIGGKQTVRDQESLLPLFLQQSW